MGRKKFVDTGAPAYMAQFTALMTLLLAFFILLNVLADKKESGFKDGIGQIRNAFGQSGGLGVFSFTFAGKGAAHPPAPPTPKDAEIKESGFEEDIVRGDGGQGSSDAETEKKTTPTYLRYRLPVSFPPETFKPDEEMVAKLDQIGLGLALFDARMDIKCFSIDTGNFRLDRNIATKRAANILAYFNAKYQIPFENMTSSGYGSKRYFEKSLETEASEAEKAGADFDSESKQGIYIYIFVNKKK